MIKIDVFLHKPQSYTEEALKRKIKDTLEETKEATEFFFSSPEDSILNKLQWYEIGERASERQWLDVSGIIKVQSTNLDTEYLRKWGEILQLKDLLSSAFHEAGLDL